LARKSPIIAVLLILLALSIATLIAGKLSIPSVMDIYGCREMFSRYSVDADVARQNVPSKWDVKIDGNGKALLLIMVQQCEKMVLDNVINVGSVGMSHIWIELEGLDEVVTPLSGTTRSLPTRYWHILPHQLDNRLARVLFGLVGVDAQFVRDISLGGDPARTRFGQVIETDSPKSNYYWTEISQLYSEPDIVTGSQRFYRRYGVRESEAYAKCESHFLGDSQVSLEASPSSGVGELEFGMTFEGFSNPVFVKHCQVNYRVHFFQRD